MPIFVARQPTSEKIIKDFKSKNIDVLVVDLRDNGGGFLNEAVNLTGLFIGKGACSSGKIV